MIWGSKHLFYVLFVRPTSVHVSGGSTFSPDGVGLVPLMLPGYTTLKSLSLSYYNPTYCTNTFSFSSIKFYSGFRRASHEALSSFTF